MYTLYALHNRSGGKIYIGQTRELEKRLELYKQKSFRGYTSRFKGEWELIYQEKVPTRSEALRRERELKSHKGRDFLRSHIPG